MEIILRFQRVKTVANRIGKNILYFQNYYNLFSYYKEIVDFKKMAKILWIRKYNISHENIPHFKTRKYFEFPFPNIYEIYILDSKIGRNILNYFGETKHNILLPPNQNITTNFLQK